jgi:hypothetical protein
LTPLARRQAIWIPLHRALPRERLDMPVEHGTHAQAPLIEDTGKQMRL